MISSSDICSTDLNSELINSSSSCSSSVVAIKYSEKKQPFDQ